MIYGVSIFLNDVDFSRKKHSEQVVTRMSEEGFFTSKQAATSFYNYHREQWKQQKGIVYGKYDVRGRCEMYKAEVSEGKIMNRGITIYKDTI